MPDAPTPRTGTGAAKTGRGAILRDQQRALFAYEKVGTITDPDARKEYKTAVNALGANIMRSGLAAAMAALERQKDRADKLLEHLAAAGVPSLEGADKSTLPRRVRALDVDSYMIATREMLQVVGWLKRAAQALFGGN